jgi:hypothetical protein
MSETAKPSPAVSSSAIAAQCPMLPVSASRCPGSGLAAGVWCLVRPSGKSTVFCRKEVGSDSAAGAMAVASATASSRATPTNRHIALMPSLVAMKAAITGIAGQAVDFIAEATPSTTPAHMDRRPGRAASASVTSSSAMTGGSVMPTLSGNAITGEEAANTVASSTCREQDPQARCGAASQNAAASSTTEKIAIHSRGSPNRPVAPSALGMPKIAINGRYGLYESQESIWLPDK